MLPDHSLLAGTSVHSVPIDQLLRVINQRIEVLLDRDHLIGHSYFLPLTASGVNSEALLASIFQNKLIPLLQEYFFSDWEKIGWVLNDVEKNREHKFVQMLADKESHSRLFSEQISQELQDRRYRINTQAFYSPQAYQGILAAES